MKLTLEDIHPIEEAPPMFIRGRKTWIFVTQNNLGMQNGWSLIDEPIIKGYSGPSLWASHWCHSNSAPCLAEDRRELRRRLRALVIERASRSEDNLQILRAAQLDPGTCFAFKDAVERDRYIVKLIDSTRQITSSHMNPQQKAVIRELLALCVSHGFGHYYPLAPIAQKLGITQPLYDNNRNKGLLWKLGRHGDGLIDVTTDGKSAAIPYDQHQSLARWVGFKG